MRTFSTLLAIALASLPVVANAQRVPGFTGSPDSARLSTTVSLTRPGTHSNRAAVLAPGLEVVDEQQVDVDGDGDQDSLALVDLVESDSEPKLDMGRGVVVLYRDRAGWRGETVASVSVLPVEAGYNWGRVETLRAGTTPLLHVLYSQAGVGGERQADTVLHFDSGALRAVYSQSVESVRGDAAVARTLDVRATDTDGDGTCELLERVTERTRAHGPRDSRRVLHWDATRGEFVASRAMDPGRQASAAGARSIANAHAARTE